MIKGTFGKIVSLAAIGVLAALVGLLPLASADYNHNLIIADSIFNNTNTLNIGQINSFLNQFPSSCISPNNGFSSPDPTGYSPGTSFTFGANVTAGQVIYDAAQAYGLNPQVLLTTLQKEQSLVTGSAGCYPNSPDPGSATPMTNACGNGTRNCTNACVHSGGCIPIAVGYGCPNYCDVTDEGFSKQVVLAAWLFKFSQQRSLGNTGWNVQANNFPQNGDHWDNSDDPHTDYSGPMTQGNLSRGNGSPVTFYDGYTTIDGQSVHMDSGATAALYTYTPHFSGNQSFITIFTNWFGSTTSDINNDYLTFIRLNHSSGNVEDVGYSSISNYANLSGYYLTGYPAVPGDGSVVPRYWVNGDLVFLRLNHSSGNTELVSYSATSGFHQIVNYSLTGYPAVIPDGSVVPLFWPPNGDLVFLRLNHSSGNVELISYSVGSNFKKIVNYQLTGYPAVPGDGSVVPLFWPNGDLVFVRLNHNSGNVELVSYSASSGFKKIDNYTLTGYPAVPGDGAVVPRFKPNGDLSFIRLNDGSGNAQVVTYSAASNYKQLVSIKYTGYPAVTPDGSVVPLFTR